MVGTITPVVYGRKRFSNWCSVIAIYSTFQVAGAAATGVAFAAFGLLLDSLGAFRTPVAGTVVFVGIAGAMLDLKLLPFSLPSRYWQVPQRWKRYPPVVMAALYGGGIGLGVLTRIPHASLYLVLAACVGLASPVSGVALMTFYGASRAGTVAVLAWSQRYASDPHDRLNTVGHLAPLAGYLSGLVLAFLSGVLLYSFLYILI